MKNLRIDTGTVHVKYTANELMFDTTFGLYGRNSNVNVNSQTNICSTLWFFDLFAELFSCKYVGGCVCVCVRSRLGKHCQCVCAKSTQFATMWCELDARTKIPSITWIFMQRRWYTNIQIHIRIAYELINRRFAVLHTQIHWTSNGSITCLVRNWNLYLLFLSAEWPTDRPPHTQLSQ